MRAVRYLERRLLHSVLLLVAISMLAFGVTHLGPGSFLDELRVNPRISPETIDALRVEYGLDRSLAVQYVRWLASVSSGDFGYSLAYNVPVTKLLASRARNTFLLGASAMLIAWTCALPLGIWVAYRPRSWIDQGSSWVSTLLLSIPELALAMLFMLAAARSGIASAGGMTSLSSEQTHWQAIADVIGHLLLPAIVLALVTAPILVRHVRAAMLEAWNSPFIHAAQGHGIGDGRLLLCHALPAASNPLITLFGLSLAGLVSGSFLIEVITGWPGLGPLFIDAVFARDLHIVIAVVMLFSVVLVLANFTSDLLLYAVDPRVRTEC